MNILNLFKRQDRCERLTDSIFRTVLREVFNLNDYELKFITRAKVGSCLFKTARKRIKLNVILTDDELQAFSTTPI